METTSTDSSLRVPLSEAAPALKALKRRTAVRFDHRAFTRLLLEYMRRDPNKVYHPDELKGYMSAQTEMGISGVSNHLRQMVDTRSIKRIGESHQSRYQLAANGLRIAQAPHKAKAVKATKVTAARAQASGVTIDSDETLLNQFLAVLVQMEGWAQRQKKRDAHYRKLLTLLKEVE